MTLSDRDHWYEMFERQRKHWTREAVHYTVQSRTEVHNALCLHIIGEVVEVLNCKSWKLHRGSPERSRDELLEELVDTLKFLMCLMAHHGFGPRDVLKAFRQKSDIVEQRAKQERKNHAPHHKV